MTVPEVTVVIPAYNSAWSIGDTIRSVLSQTLRDIEVVVVNDGSTDNLDKVLAPFLAADKRLRVVSQTNGGLAAARNRGLAECRSPLVAFLDADDLWHPDFLSLLAGALGEAESAPFAYAYSFRIDSRNRVLHVPQWDAPPRHDFLGLLAVNSVGNGSAALFRREAVQQEGGFDATLRARGVQGAEDWKLCLQLAARHAPVLVPRLMVAYRLVDSSMSQSDPSRQMRAVRAAMDDIRRQFPGIPAAALRDARTTMNGWLLGAYARQRRYGSALRLLAESYGLNPLWVLNPDLRRLHRLKLSGLLRPTRPFPLADWAEGARRPFAYLADSPLSAD